MKSIVIVIHGVFGTRTLFGLFMCLPNGLKWAYVKQSHRVTESQTPKGTQYTGG